MLDHLHQNHSINLSKFSYVPACKKSTLSFTSFLRYCREIANFLFWVIWACLATHIKNDSITLKKRLTIISREKSTPSFTFSLKYCKDIIKLLSWVLWACLVMHTQSDTINLKNFCVYLQVKNQFHSPCFSGDTAKICKHILGTLGMSGYS